MRLTHIKEEGWAGADPIFLFCMCKIMASMVVTITILMILGAVAVALTVR